MPWCTSVNGFLRPPDKALEPIAAPGDNAPVTGSSYRHHITGCGKTKSLFKTINLARPPQGAFYISIATDTNGKTQKVRHELLPD